MPKATVRSRRPRSSGATHRLSVGIVRGQTLFGNNVSSMVDAPNGNSTISRTLMLGGHRSSQFDDGTTASITDVQPIRFGRRCNGDTRPVCRGIDSDAGGIWIDLEFEFWKPLPV